MALITGKKENSKVNNSLSRKDASRIIRRHLIKTIPLVFEIQEGVPKGCFFYNMPEDEPCWTAHIPSQKPMIGSDRYICISKKSGKVIYDGSKGE